MLKLLDSNLESSQFWRFSQLFSVARNDSLEGFAGGSWCLGHLQLVCALFARGDLLLGMGFSSTLLHESGLKASLRVGNEDGMMPSFKHASQLMNNLICLCWLCASAL